MNTQRRLTRSSTDRVIAGVAGGVAQYLDIDPTLVRLGFVLLVFVGGVSPLIYLLLWVVMPSEQNAGEPFSQQIRENASDLGQRVSELANTVGGQINQMLGSNTSQSTTPPSQPNTQSGPATGPTRRLDQ